MAATPHLHGSIVQPGPWLMSNPGPSANWSDELDLLAGMGADSIMLQYVAESTVNGWVTRVYFPTDGGPQPRPGEDIVTSLLAAAKSRQMGVYLGLQMQENWDQQAVFGDWPAREAAVTRMLAVDLLGSYAGEYPDTIKGWFLTPELFETMAARDWTGQPMPPSVLQTAVAQYLTLATQNLRTVSSARMPIVIAPTFDPEVRPANIAAFQQMLRTLLQADVDVVMLQDRTGEAPAIIAELPSWYQAARSVIDDVNTRWQRSVELWADVELYRIRGGSRKRRTTDTRWTTAPLAEAAPAIEVANTEAEKSFCFSIDHWVSHLGYGSEELSDQYREYLNP